MTTRCSYRVCAFSQFQQKKKRNRKERGKEKQVFHPKVGKDGSSKGDDYKTRSQDVRCNASVKDEKNQRHQQQPIQLRVEFQHRQEQLIVFVGPCSSGVKNQGKRMKMKKKKKRRNDELFECIKWTSYLRVLEFDEDSPANFQINFPQEKREKDGAQNRHPQLNNRRNSVP
jgi:hypothetical protein